MLGVRMNSPWEPMESIDISEMRFEDVEEAKRVAAGLSAQVHAAFGDSTGYSAIWDCRGYWTLARVHTLPDERNTDV